jgi:hypothetical protein
MCASAHRLRHLWRLQVLEGCVSVHGGFVYPHLDQPIVPREPVPYFRSVLDLELHLSGCLHWPYKAKGCVGLL